MTAHCMQTHTGLMVDLCRIAEEDIRIEDIAHALSQIIRFTGHANRPYTVAQHSMLVADLCPEEHRMWGLMHDAAEAYVGDVATPLKSLLPDYQQIEERIQKIVAGRFGLCWPIPDSVKQADREALMIEKADLFNKRLPWPGEFPPSSRREIKNVLNPESAKWLFIEMYKELSGAAS
jgi:5'-deoxynucleotidase YfbR-like HD superfamily hydrolase